MLSQAWEIDIQNKKKTDKQSGLHQTGEDLCSLTKENKEEITKKIEWYKDTANNKYFLASKQICSTW